MNPLKSPTTEPLNIDPSIRQGQPAHDDKDGKFLFAHASALHTGTISMHKMCQVWCLMSPVSRDDFIVFTDVDHKGRAHVQEFVRKESAVFFENSWLKCQPRL